MCGLVCFYLFLPVERDRAVRRHVARGGRGVEVNLERRALHDRENLVRALIERAGRKVSEEPIFHLRDVVFGGAEG